MTPPPEDTPPSIPYSGLRPPYGSGLASADFRGIGAALLKTFPRITPEPVDSFVPAPETKIQGEHFVASLQVRSDGSRASPCPVCLTHTEVPGTAGWVPLRCGICGTEFVASDGSPPPPPKPVPVPTFGVAESRLLSLILLSDGGARHARCPVCHSLESVMGYGGRVEMRCGSCGSDFTATDRIPPSPAHPTSAPELPPPPPFRHPIPAFPASPPPTVDEVRTAPDGSMFALCPQCHRFNVNVPHTSSASVVLKCPGCWKLFLVHLPTRRTSRLPLKELELPPLPPGKPIYSRRPPAAAEVFSLATLGCVVLFPVLSLLIYVVFQAVLKLMILW